MHVASGLIDLIPLGCEKTPDLSETVEESLSITDRLSASCFLSETQTNYTKINTKSSFNLFVWKI